VIKVEKVKERTMTELDFHRFAHEIKNPLAICSGYLEILSKNKKAKVEDYLKIVEKEIHRSLNIINDYSKNQFMKIEKEEFDLTLLLEEAVGEYNNLFQENNSRILLLEQESHYLTGDYQKIKQVMINLLKNAYEAKSEKPLLVVIQIITYKEYYQILITDNGIGMNKKELEKIGTEYYTTKEEGTGLGIPYCKEIIIRHGGNLFFQSKKNIGTRIIITLPK